MARQRRPVPGPSKPLALRSSILGCATFLTAIRPTSRLDHHTARHRAASAIPVPGPAARPGRPAMAGLPRPGGAIVRRLGGRDITRMGRTRRGRLDHHGAASVQRSGVGRARGAIANGARVGQTTWPWPSAATAGDGARRPGRADAGHDRRGGRRDARPADAGLAADCRRGGARRPELAEMGCPRHRLRALAVGQAVALTCFVTLSEGTGRGCRGTLRGAGSGSICVPCVHSGHPVTLFAQAERPEPRSCPLLIRGFGVRVPGGAPALTSTYACLAGCRHGLAWTEFIRWFYAHVARSAHTHSDRPGSTSMGLPRTRAAHRALPRRCTRAGLPSSGQVGCRSQHLDSPGV